MLDPISPAELRRQYFLEAMRIPVWLPRDRGRSPDTSGAKPDAETGAGAVDEGDLAALRVSVAACTACGLHETRQQTVFGAGDARANCMIIGEAPGADEDRLGEPFVGRAGRLLGAMLRALDLSRDDVYITNMLKCRPPNNRDPKPEEIAHCETFLRRQIALVEPAVILAVGRVAAQNLLRIKTSLGRMRGQDYVDKESGIPVVVTYHPAYLLRSPVDKRKAWVDLLRIRQIIDAAQS